MMVRSLDSRLAGDTRAKPMVAQRLRVLIVGDFSASKVGNASVAEQLAVKLSAAGDVVHTTSAKTNRLARVTGMIIDTARFRQTVDVGIVDVYAGRGFLWAEWTTAILKSANKPVIHVLRSGSLPDFAAAQPERVRRLFAASDSVVALSGYLSESMSAYGTISEVIPNPIEVANYPFKRRSPVRPKIVWLRTFNRQYNPALAPRVLAELPAVLGTTPFSDSVQLTMYGADQRDGSLESTVAAARELGVSERLHIPGAVAKSEVPERLAEGDIFINTTDVDNVPISVVEAMACGLCVVSTDVGGMRYLIANGVDGLLVPRDDARAMASAIGRLLTDAELAERLSTNARLKAESFDWTTVLPQWRDHIAKVTARHVRR